jgi:hypothetical protein
VIERGRVIHLSGNDAALLLNLLENPPAPNPRLRQALRNYESKKPMLNIQALRENHDRSRFESGSGELDLWLRQTAQQHQRHRISKTFVAVADDDPSRILGFYALTACEVLCARICQAILPRDCRGKFRASGSGDWRWTIPSRARDSGVVAHERNRPLAAGAG